MPCTPMYPTTDIDFKKKYICTNMYIHSSVCMSYVYVVHGLERFIGNYPVVPRGNPRVYGARHF